MSSDSHLQTTIAPRPSSAASTPLPDDLLVEQSVRIQIFYAVGVALWLLNFLLDVELQPNGDRGPYRLWIEGGAALLAAGLAAFTRYSPASLRLKRNLGVAAIVPHAFALAMLNSWAPQPLSMRPLSGVTALLLFFGMMAPSSPRKMLGAALVAALMDPLGVWIAHWRGLQVPGPIATVLMFYPNYICAVLAVAPARILYRVGRKLREARALGSYQLIRRLGEGGMGEVWLARHCLLARNAAIKLVRPEMLGDGDAHTAQALGRFEREARATAALSSPHTIRVFDFGLTDQGTFYYVMELLDGLDLETLVREFGPLPPARAMHIVRQICESLAEAHAKGVVHRDIKPANIYVCRIGLEYDFVKVLDFGLVKIEAADATAATATTMQSVMMGTPGYMAPEVILGAADVDSRVDVYGVGCVAYYLLTGRQVFEADSRIKMLMHHADDDPVAPSRRTRQPIPREVDDFVLACLRRNRQARPEHAGELLEQVDACLAANTWDREHAHAWWRSHLPHLAQPTTIANPDWDVDARAYAVTVAGP